MNKTKKRKYPDSVFWGSVVTAAAIVIAAAIGLADKLTDGNDGSKADVRIESLAELMLTNYREGFYDQAEKWADEILTSQPNNNRALNMKGSVAFHQGSYQAAIKYFSKALESLREGTPLFDTYRQAYISNLADTYVELKGYKRAIKLYESVSDNSPEWSYAIGRAYMHDGEYDKALNYLQAVATSNGQGRARVLEAASLMGLAGLEQDSTKASVLRGEASSKLHEGIIQNRQYWEGVFSGQLVDVRESHTIARNLLKEILPQTALALGNVEQGDCCRQGPP